MAQVLRVVKATFDSGVLVHWFAAREFVMYRLQENDVDILSNVVGALQHVEFETWELLIEFCVQRRKLGSALDFMMRMERAGMKPSKKLAAAVLELQDPKKKAANEVRPQHLQ